LDKVFWWPKGKQQLKGKATYSIPAVAVQRGTQLM